SQTRHLRRGHRQPPGDRGEHPLRVFHKLAIAVLTPVRRIAWRLVQIIIGRLNERLPNDHACPFVLPSAVNMPRLPAPHSPLPDYTSLTGLSRDNTIPARSTQTGVFDDQSRGTASDRARSKRRAAAFFDHPSYPDRAAAHRAGAAPHLCAAPRPSRPVYRLR